MPRHTTTVLAAMLLASGLSFGAGAQPMPAPMQPQMQPQAPMMTPDGTAQAARPQRPRITSLEYSQMNRGQQRRVQQAMAGAGQTPLSPDQAAQRWASMDARARRAALRATRPVGQQQRPPRQPAPAMQQ